MNHRLSWFTNSHALKDGLHLIGRNGGTNSVVLTIFVGTCLQTLIANLVVGGLTQWQFIVFFQGNLWVNMVVVSTVVGDVCFTIAVNQRQVTVTIKAAYTSSTDRDQVAVIDVVYRCRSIAIYRRGIGIHIGRTRRGVTTGKYSIMNNHTFLVDISLTQCQPV